MFTPAEREVDRPLDRDLTSALASNVPYAIVAGTWRPMRVVNFTDSSIA